MKRIKIFLQRPWRTSDSPYYKYLREYPLEEVEYINTGDFGVIQNKNKLMFNNWLKQMIKTWVRRIYPSMPNAHYTKSNKKYDLIHCAHCISKNKSPWVCDIEFVGQFWAAGPHKDFPSKKRILKYITSPYCKKILAWSEWTKDGILKEFPEVKDKLEVLYPAIPIQKIKRRSSSKINLLFVGRDFELKGGLVALSIFDKLTKKYGDVSATIVSDAPKNIIKKYVSNKKIKFYKLMSHEKLFGKIYPNADIFVYPTFSDTFGFAILEAQSFGLPVVGMKTKSTHTIQETISDGKTGFVIENLDAEDVNRVVSNKVADELLGAVEKLIKNRSLLKNMSSNCVKEIRSGKFSIDKKNKVLKKVYVGAVA